VAQILLIPWLRVNEMKLSLPGVMLSLLLAAGCGRAGADSPSTYTAPNLSGAYADEQGVLRTVCRTLGIISFGERVEGELPGSYELYGYEFEAFSDTVPVIELQSAGAGVRPALALYGPRTEQGRWGDPLDGVAAESPGKLQLAGLELGEPGLYFILIQNRTDRAAGRYALQLGCRGSCWPPSCTGLQPCDLVCKLGFAVDEEGCRVCRCLEGTECVAAEDACPEGQECGEDGRCRPLPDPCAGCPGVYEPVCGSDGRTYGNPCRARCSGVEPIHAGVCREPPPCDEGGRCPAPLVCREGRCVEVSCSCPPLSEPVCSRSGRTWRNLCELQCRPGEELAYFGECRRQGCTADRQCPEGTACMPLEDEENLARCRREPRGPECLRECRPARPATCGPEVHCPERQLCYALNLAREGACLPLCRLGEPGGCPPGQLCAMVPQVGEGEEIGLCLPACSAGEPRPCPPETSCQPDGRGEPVCQACLCPDEGPPVCGRSNRTHRNACAARCAGERWFREGACEELPPDCICPWVHEPVCGADGVLYNNLCEAGCAEQELAEPKRCFDGRVELACRHPEDCRRTGCGETVCAAAPSQACPTYSGEAICHVRHGVCGCVDGRCLFQPTPEARVCLEEQHRRR